MVQSKATTVKDYLAELTPERRADLATVRDTIRDRLPAGYLETMQHGMISYVIPLDRYPDTYNGHALAPIALAAQKHHMAVYLYNIYGDPVLRSWFEGEYERTGKRMDIGRSCIRFRRLDDLPLALIGEAVAKTPPDDFIAIYERARSGTKRGR